MVYISSKKLFLSYGTGVKIADFYVSLWKSNVMKGDSLLAFVAGAAAGLTLGLLFAPEKGEETRRKLKETVGDAADSAKARARLARMELNDLRAELQDQAEDLKEDVRMKILERLEKLESAIQKDIEYAERPSENA